MRTRDSGLRHSGEEISELSEGFKFNFTKKEDARKLLEQEQAFKELGVEVFT